jgi:NitT/TauT family transport system ATP-binding protein
MNGEPLIELVEVARHFGAERTLEAIDLRVLEGEFVSIIGPSGCGKSTLLRLVAGLLQPTGGAIRIGGRPPGGARREMAFVFQEPSLLPWRRVAANVELPLSLRGDPPESRRQRTDEMLDLVGLSADARKYPWQLSGGMKMRVSLARALTLAPKILLLDEPFGALDELTRDRLNEDLLRVRAQAPFTALFVTHSIAEAIYLSTRVIVLAPLPGRIAAEVAVPLGYPRPPALREDPRYLELVAHAGHALREQLPR